MFKIVGWGLILLSCVLLGWWGVRMARTALSLRGHVAELQAVLDRPRDVQPDAACGLVLGVAADLRALERDAGGLVRLAPLLGWAPRVGGELRAAPHLLAAAEGLGEVGRELCETLQPVLDSLDQDDGGLQLSPAGIASVLAENQAAWESALTAAARAEAAWQQVDITSLSPGIAARLAPLEQGIPLLRPGLSALAVAPQLLGMDRPRTYLVLALNEDELRPGGGFITGVGEVRLDAGQVISVNFGDSYAADDFSLPYPDPPDPLRRYLGLDLWVFRDSNWSPDFPTTARQAMALYRPGYPVTVDGVIALDQRAVQGLVGALSPLTIGEDGETVTGETVISHIRDAWAPGDAKQNLEWWRQRKSFMEPLAAAVLQRIEGGQVDWSTLARTAMDLVRGKHLLAYLSEPSAQALLAALGWDAALRPGPGDFLAITDANLGYNKANARVNQVAAYTVDLAAVQPTASLVLTYTHTTVNDYPCRPEVRLDRTYEQMMDRCYWDYLRVYVPQGSQLRDATRLPVPASATWDKTGDSGEVAVRPVPEGPWLSLEVLAVLPPATTQTRSFTWTLPSGVVQVKGDEGSYTLHLIKQPSAAAYPVTLRVRLPEGAVLLDATHTSGLSGTGGWHVVRLNLDRDQVFGVRWRKAQ